MNNPEELDYYALSQLPLENFENQPYYSYPYLNIREAFGRQFSRFWSIYRVNQIIYNAKQLKEWKDTVLAVDSAIGNSNVQLEGAEVIITDFYRYKDETPYTKFATVDRPHNGKIPLNVKQNYRGCEKSKIEQLANTSNLPKKRFVFSAKGGTGGIYALYAAGDLVQWYRDKTGTEPLEGQIRVITFDTEFVCDDIYRQTCHRNVPKHSIIQFQRPSIQKQADPLIAVRIPLSLYAVAKENSITLAFAAISLLLTALVSYLFILPFLLFCYLAYSEITNGTPRKETFVQSALSSVGMFSSSVNSSSHTNQDLDNIRRASFSKA